MENSSSLGAPAENPIQPFEEAVIALKNLMECGAPRHVLREARNRVHSEQRRLLSKLAFIKNQPPEMASKLKSVQAKLWAITQNGFDGKPQGGQKQGRPQKSRGRRAEPAVEIVYRRRVGNPD